MEMKDEVRYLLKPLNTTSRGFYAFIAVLVAVIGVAGYAWYVQLTQGLGVTGMNDTTIWGLYISNFIFFIGISHAGIAISAAVRLASLDKYKPIMRIAEALTLASLLMAAFSIVMDMGRPDRSFMLIKHYLERIGQSPLLWDVTAVSTYLVLSVTYLYFSLREDMAILKDEVGGWRGKLYRLLLPWHEEGEQETISRVAWWMAVCILPIMVMVHTTVAWIFSLLPNRPLWFGAVAGPYFIVAAVSSGIATVVVIACVLRYLFGWEDYIKPGIIKGLTSFMAITTLVYMYFMFAEHMTARFAAPAPEVRVSNAWFFGEFSLLFWVMFIFGLFIPTFALIINAIRSKEVNIKLTVAASTIIVLALWVKRVLIIVPTQSRPLMPLDFGLYVPTWVEWAMVAGTFAVAALIYTVFLKVFPIVEIAEELH
jgi:molybdopterin-containing oxidoreductase family membrane subunit